MLSHSERKHVGVNCENFHEVEIKHYIACLTYINRKQSEGEPQSKNKRLHFSAYQDRIVVKKINEAECRHVASKFPLRVKGSPTDSWLNLMSCELLPSFHRLETFLQFTSGFGLFTLQNKLRLNELVEAQSTQLPATVIEVFRSQKAFSDSNSTHSAVPPARSIPVSAAKFIQHLCPEVKHFRP